MYERAGLDRAFDRLEVDPLQRGQEKCHVSCTIDGVLVAAETQGSDLPILLGKDGATRVNPENLHPSGSVPRWDLVLLIKMHAHELELGGHQVFLATRKRD